MKLSKFTFSIILIFFVLPACNHATTNCTKINQIKLGHILLPLPACYKVIRPDTTAHESDFFIVKNNHVKLKGIAGLALTSLDETIAIQQDKSINLYTDTVGPILRQIGYYKNHGKYHILINFINLKDRITLIGDLLKRQKLIDSELANKQFSVLLNAGIEQDNIYVNKEDIDNLSEEDIDILISAFKKSTIIK